MNDATPHFFIIPPIILKNILRSATNVEVTPVVFKILPSKDLCYKIDCPSQNWVPTWSVGVLLETPTTLIRGVTLIELNNQKFCGFRIHQSLNKKQVIAYFQRIIVLLLQHTK